MPEGFQVTKCCCGHPMGDHQSNRARLLITPQKYGICLVEGCECRRYAEPEGEADRAA